MPFPKGMRHPKRKDRIGEKINRWEIIEELGFRIVGKNRKTFVRCKCDCGKIVDVSLGNVLSGMSKSCGCLKKEHKNPGKGRGVAAGNSLFGAYRTHAFNKGTVFELSVSEFIALTKKNCTYCGAAPSQIYMLYKVNPDGTKTPRINGEHVYNGIDKQVPSEGYTASNSVPCCFTCNRAKSNMPLSDFISWINQLVKHRKEIENAPSGSRENISTIVGRKDG